MIFSQEDTINKKTVLELFHEKHSQPSEVNLNYFVDPQAFNSIPYHPSIFKNISSTAIKKRPSSHGLSGLDANEWRRILTCFKENSKNFALTLCKIIMRLSIEKFPKKIWQHRTPVASNHNENPGVRPIFDEAILLCIIVKSITERI